MRRFILTITVALFFEAGATSLVLGQNRAEPNAFVVPLGEALALPISPGAIALLFPHARDIQAQARFKEALSDPRASVRALAARAYYVNRLDGSDGHLIELLRNESDPAVSQELVRALASDLSDASNGAILEATGRLSMPETTARALGAARASNVLALLPALRAMGLESDALPSVYRLATRKRIKVLGAPAAKALREGDVEAWTAILSVARGDRVSFDSGLLTAGQSSANAAIRDATLFHYVSLISGSIAFEPPSVFLQMAKDFPEPDESSPGSTTSASHAVMNAVDRAFLLEILARHANGEVAENEAWIEAREADAPTKLAVLSFRPGPVWELLTKDELRAWSKQVTGENKDYEERLEKYRETKAGSGFSSTSIRSRVRMASGFSPGLIKEILELTDCLPDKEALVGAEISFDASGVPRTISMIPVTASDACNRASQALFLVAGTPQEALPVSDFNETVFFSFAPAWLDCVGNAHPVPSSAVKKVGPYRIEPPKKRKDVPPRYPEAAKQARESGVVILEAVITTSGCVDALKVLRGRTPLLDLAAMQAVAQWQYEPSYLEGVPVPIAMTVTVNFALN